MIERLENDEFDVKKEALGGRQYPTAGGAERADGARAQMLVSWAASAVVKMLEVNDAAMQKLMLEAVGTLLDAGDLLAKAKGGDNAFLKPFDEAEGIDKLEALQTHHNEEVYEKAVAILEKHFGEDDDDDENILPNTANDNMFSGGTARPLRGSARYNTNNDTGRDTTEARRHRCRATEVKQWVAKS